MSISLLIAAVTKLNKIIKEVTFSYNSTNTTASIMGKGNTYTYDIIYSDLYPTVEFYLSQLLNPLDLRVDLKYPELRKYIKLYFIEDNKDNYIGVEQLFEFKDTGIIRYRQRVANNNQIGKLTIEKVSDEEAYLCVESVHTYDWEVIKVNRKIHIGIYNNKGTEYRPSPSWMDYINTVMDFYSNPNNQQVKHLLEYENPKYKGKDLWVLQNNIVFANLGGHWIPLLPGQEMPNKIVNEYTLFKNLYNGEG